MRRSVDSVELNVARSAEVTQFFAVYCVDLVDLDGVALRKWCFASAWFRLEHDSATNHA